MTQDLVFAAAVLAILYAIYAFDRRRRLGNGATGDGTSDNGGTGSSATEHGTECCGKHAVCGKQKLAEARMREARYFDDEELDRFKGRNSDSYDDNEIEEFRYVMYTMRKDEIRTWMECIEAREIELPDQLKEEAWSMMNE